METAGAIIVAAGRGKRMGTKESKQFMPLSGKPVLIYALQAFDQTERFEHLVVVTGEQDTKRVRALAASYQIRTPVTVVTGGEERQYSVYAGLQELACKWVLVHDAARPFIQPADIERCLSAAQEHDSAAVLAVRVKDTIKAADTNGVITHTPDRSTLWTVQTPQAFRTDRLREAHMQAAAARFLGTDDAMLIERSGGRVHVVEGSYENIKLTTPDDWRWAEEKVKQADGNMSKDLDRGMNSRQAAATAEGDEQMIRIGQGYDVHQLAEGRACMIGGVTIPHETGLLGHSDADVLLHAITDAVLGALALGDIGKHFPDTDAAFKDADSLKLLQQVWTLVKEKGYRLGNVDATIIAQRPKMGPYIPQMQEIIADALEADIDAVNVKATTTERLGFVGREEGIAAQAVVCLQKNML